MEQGPAKEDCDFPTRRREDVHGLRTSGIEAKEVDSSFGGGFGSSIGVDRRGTGAVREVGEARVHWNSRVKVYFPIINAIFCS